MCYGERVFSLKRDVKIEKRNDNVGFDKNRDFPSIILFSFSLSSPALFFPWNPFFWDGTHLSFIARSHFRWQKKDSEKGGGVEAPLLSHHYQQINKKKPQKYKTKLKE